jgi:hypothetical protein
MSKARSIIGRDGFPTGAKKMRGGKETYREVGRRRHQPPPLVTKSWR